MPFDSTTLVLIEDSLSNSNPLWCYFNQFILTNICNRFFKTEYLWRYELDLFFSALHTDVSQMLSFARIHFHVVIKYILTDNHALIARCVGGDKKCSFLFHISQGIGCTYSGGCRYNGALGVLLHSTCVLVVIQKLRLHEGAASGVVNELSTESEHATRGHLKLEHLPPIWLVFST